MTIDEYSIRERVLALKQQGFPASEGYFLIVLTETEASELSKDLRKKYGGRWIYDPRYDHPPAALEVTMRRLGLMRGFIVGDAFVVYRPECGVSRIGRAKHL